MPNCKPGDLAVVVVSANPRHLGLFVTVLAPITPGDRLPCGRRFKPVSPGDAPFWLCKPAHPVEAPVFRNGEHLGFQLRADNAVFVDARLRPIRPPGTPADTTTSTPKEHVPA